jgi:hypothetical protein
MGKSEKLKAGKNSSKNNKINIGSDSTSSQDIDETKKEKNPILEFCK